MKINWLTWQKETFEKALKEGKPLLLSIAATWCHWCHVMDEGTYANEEIAKAIEANFVAVRVDTDERPDVNERYNQGGWPSTVFLTPLGQILTGATYVPAEEMQELLAQVLLIFEAFRFHEPQREKPEEDQEKASDEEKRIHFIKYRQIFLQKFDQLLLQNFDPVYGGFNSEGPKFPLTEALNYCLLKFKKTGSPDFRRVLLTSLDGMAEQSLFDHLEGGFFRYCLDRKWQRPHYEKLLEDNLKLLALYDETAALFFNSSYRETAQKTWEFIKNWLNDPQTGGFYASVAADENYYNLVSRGERQSYRRKTQKPSVDQTIYADLNCLAVTTLLEASNRKYLKEMNGLGAVATRTLAFIRTNLQTRSGFLAHFKKNKTLGLSDLLVDQVRLLEALLNEGSGSSLTLAKKFWGKVSAAFSDRENGGFFDRRTGSSEGAGLLGVPLKPLESNVVAVRVLQKLGTKKEINRALIELFWQNKNPNPKLGSLASLLLEL